MAQSNFNMSLKSFLLLVVSWCARRANSLKCHEGEVLKTLGGGTQICETGSDETWRAYDPLPPSAWFDSHLPRFSACWEGMEDGKVKQFTFGIQMTAGWVSHYQKHKADFARHGYHTLQESPGIFMDKASYLFEQQFGVRLLVGKVVTQPNSPSASGQAGNIRFATTGRGWAAGRGVCGSRRNNGIASLGTTSDAFLKSGEFTFRGLWTLVHELGHLFGSAHTPVDKPDIMVVSGRRTYRRCNGRECLYRHFLPWLDGTAYQSTICSSVLRRESCSKLLDPVSSNSSTTSSSGVPGTTTQIGGTTTTTAPVVIQHLVLRQSDGSGCLKSKGRGQLLETNAVSGCAKFIVNGQEFRSLEIPGQCLDFFRSVPQGWGLWNCHGRLNQQLQRRGSKWCVAGNRCVEVAQSVTTTTTTTSTVNLLAIESGDIVFLKTRSGHGNHIDIEENMVQARWASQGSWQAIVVEKESGGSIRSGDTVFLKTHTGAFIDIVGNDVRARFHDKGDWQAVTINRKSGAGYILPDDLICLKAHTGKYLDVENQDVQARWDACDDWQTMLIEKEVHGALFSGDYIHLAAHTGKLVDIEGSAVSARWTEGGAWQTFRIHSSGGRTISSGDAVFLEAHTGKMLDVEGFGVQARWHDWGSWQTLIIENHRGGAVLRNDVIFLQAHTGNRIEVDGDRVQARWAEKGLWQSLIIWKTMTSRRLDLMDSFNRTIAIPGAIVI